MVKSYTLVMDYKHGWEVTEMRYKYFGGNDICVGVYYKSMTPKLKMVVVADMEEIDASYLRLLGIADEVFVTDNDRIDTTTLRVFMDALE